MASKPAPQKTPFLRSRRAGIHACWPPFLAAQANREVVRHGVCVEGDDADSAFNAAIGVAVRFTSLYASICGYTVGGFHRMEN